MLISSSLRPIHCLIFGLFISTSRVCADHRTGFHWARTSSSFTLGIVTSLQNSGVNDWEDNIDWAVDQWSKSDVMDLANVSGQSNQSSRSKCNTIDGYVHVCNADYGQTTWSGKAQWSYTIGYSDEDHDGHIVSCTVRLNDNESVYSEERKLLCHEIGHCLGLGHTSEDGGSDGTCMDYASGVAASRAPSNDDYTVLEDVYSHRDVWNSYELVEPARAEPVSSPTQNPTQVPLAAPTRAPVPSPTRAPVPSPTRAPVAPIPAPAEDLPKCSEHEEKDGCKDDYLCTWNKDLKQCVAEDNQISNGPPSSDEWMPEGDCGHSIGKDSCKKQHGCKWKKNECIAGQNRLLQTECAYEPVDFDVPAKAEVIACDSASVTFELVNGHIATRYHIILSPEGRRTRRRQLRGDN